jgi:hypothetical protein
MLTKIESILIQYTGNPNKVTILESELLPYLDGNEVSNSGYQGDVTIQNCYLI